MHAHRINRSLLTGLLCAWLLAFAAPAQADPGPHDDPFEAARFEQRLGEQVPLDLAFRDEDGAAVRLSDYFGSRPVVLTLVYYECPNLCSLVLNQLADTMRPLSFTPGDQFSVVTVSIDPRETPRQAMSRKTTTLERYGRPGAGQGWRFLTGEEQAIQRLAEAVGFRYAYDPATGQYAHPAGVVVLTPQGRVARYFYGIEYSARDLRLGLVEASANTIGTPVDQVLLRCYRYDPNSGAYGLAVMNLVRMAGIITALGMGAFLLTMLRRERQGSGFRVQGPIADNR